MENIINKNFKRKNTEFSDTFTVNSVENGFVLFTNGAKCKLETLQSDFEQIDNYTQQISENLETQINEINPETFFDGGIDMNLVNTFENVSKGQITNIGPSKQTVASKVVIKEDDGRVKEQIYQPTTNTTEQPQVQQNNILNRNDNAQTQQFVNTVQTPNEIRLPEQDTFDRLKKSEDVEFLIPIKIKLPKASKIEVMNDLFETSLTSYLAKQTVSDFLKNPKTLQTTIQKCIEEQVDNNLNSVTNTKQPKQKKEKQKGKVTVTELKTYDVAQTGSITAQTGSITALTAQTEISDIDKKLRPEIKEWDGDVKKLISITNNVQYEIINKKIDELKELNKSGDISFEDLDKLEDLVLTYKMNNNLL